MGAKTRKFDSAIYVRISADEHAALSAFCEASGITLSEAVRRFIRELSGFGPTLDGDDRGRILSLASQARSLGTSLNQWVKAMNTGLVPRQAGLEKWLKETHELVIDLADLHKSLCARASRRSRKIFETGKQA
jgi:hypothetical protein